MSNASEELPLEDESDATHGLDYLGAAASTHTRLGGVALGLSSHGGDHAGAVYPVLEDDCCDSNSCYRVLQTYARGPGAHMQLGSIVVLPDAKTRGTTTALIRTLL